MKCCRLAAISGHSLNKLLFSVLRDGQQLSYWVPYASHDLDNLNLLWDQSSSRKCDIDSFSYGVWATFGICDSRIELREPELE
ncbi:hypothetical protein A2U01_0048649 [Trifolium medium]|uniref:Uncharacterized protein n=1 Tax=Trifolium medium TaxID=97028 RepID=A0A392QV48_9FABA|nr:hypothetical protein [Trifolium medium]